MLPADAFQEEQQEVAHLELLLGNASTIGSTDGGSTARTLVSEASAMDDADRQHAEFELDERRQRLDDMQAKLAEEEEAARKARAQVESRERKWAAMQAKQRADQQAHAAAQIEAKRRLLDRVQAKRVVIGHSIEDIAAIEIERYTRGYFVRKRIRRYLQEGGRVVVCIQAAARGYIARRKLARHLRETAAAIILQQFWRGATARAALKALKGAQHFAVAATSIQKAWRGCLGRRRASAKMQLDRAAENAMECVGVRALFVSDLKDLADRIWASVDESQRKPFLPDEVLWLIRLVLAVLASRSAPDEQSSSFQVLAYDAASTRTHEEIHVHTVTWESAVKVLNRSNRLLRMLRSFTAVAALRPSMYLHISGTAQSLYRSIRSDHGWVDAVFAGIGVGSKCATQLFKWVTAIFQIHSLQDHFLTLLTTGEPDWLGELRQLQEAQSKQEVVIRMCGHECDVLEQLQEGEGASATVPFIQDHDVFNKARMESEAQVDAYLEAKAKEAEVAQRQLALLQQEEEHLCAKQAASEKRSAAELNLSHGYRGQQLQEVANLYQARMQRAQQQGAKAGDDMLELRTKLLEEEAAVQTIESKRRLLRLEHAHNAHLRHLKPTMSPEIAMLIKEVAECRALQFYLQLQKQEVLASVCASDPTSLAGPSLALYNDLEHKIGEAAETEQRLVQTWREHELRFKEKLNREIMRHRSLMDAHREHDVYSEQEREEDRREDEAAATLEMIRARQFVNPELLQQRPNRTRPALVVVSRDISRRVKEDILFNVRSALSGQFVVLDETESSGLHIPAIQQAFDTGQNVIAHADIGLAHGTREQFLDAAELASSSLVPSPMCMLLVGDPEDGYAGEHEAGGESVATSEADPPQQMADEPAKRHLQVSLFLG